MSEEKTIIDVLIIADDGLNYVPVPRFVSEWVTDGWEPSANEDEAHVNVPEKIQQFLRAYDHGKDVSRVYIGQSSAANDKALFILSHAGSYDSLKDFLEALAKKSGCKLGHDYFYLSY